MRHVRYYQVDLHSVPNGTGKKGGYSSVSTNILSLRDRMPFSIAPLVWTRFYLVRSIQAGYACIYLYYVPCSFNFQFSIVEDSGVLILIQ
ncbi:MAG: hypothetical protein LBG80_08765 [Bacteroidales bacterium]|nr:hypothetical protein [Bacteroidales bacterium]